MVEWMFMICDLAWRQREIPDEWKKDIVVLFLKGKDSKDECNNYRGISLLSVLDKAFESLMEKLMEITKGKVNKEGEDLGKEKVV